MDTRLIEADRMKAYRHMTPAGPIVTLQFFYRGALMAVVADRGGRYAGEPFAFQIVPGDPVPPENLPENIPAHRTAVNVILKLNSGEEIPLESGGETTLKDEAGEWRLHLFLATEPREERDGIEGHIAYEELPLEADWSAYRILP